MTAATHSDPPAHGGGSLFAVADFVRLWMAGFVSNVIVWLEMLVVALYVYQTTQSALMVAVTATVRLLPFAFLGAAIGALVDRLQPRTILRFVAVGVACSAATIAALSLLGWLHLWVLWVLVFINGVITAADLPIRRLMIGEVVGAERMRQAMAVDAATNNLSRVAGPLVGGVLAAAIGMNVFWISAAAFVVVFLLVSSVNLRIARAPAGKPSYFRQVAGGMKLIRGHPGLAGVFVITAIYNLVGWPAVSMAPVIAKGGFDLSESAVGVMVALDGCGAFLAALALRHWAPPSSYAAIFCGGVFLYLAAMIGFAASANPYAAGAFLFASGFGAAGFAIMQITLLYLQSAPEARGLILGLLATCIGLSPLGVLHIGVLAEAFGAQKAVIIMGVEGIVLTLLTMKFWRRMGSGPIARAA